MSATFGEDVADDVLEIYALFEFPVANDAYQTFATDVLFSCPNRALLRAAESGNPAFTYEFRKTVATTLLLGSHHALELPYLFGTFDELGIVPLPSDNQLSAEMQRAWTTFATHGVPQISSGWPEWSEDGETLVVLEDPVNLVSFDRFRGGRCDELAALGLVP